MNPDAERFIELATHPLGDNAELQLSAQAELRKSIEADAGNPEALAEAADSLANADQHPKRRRWRAVLVGVMLLLSLPLLGHTVLQVTEVAKLRLLFSFDVSSYSVEKGIPNLTPQQRLLLFGASGATDESGKWKPLWDSEPENAAYLALYAMAYLRDHKELSSEILAAVERIDPDNAWFPALAAAHLAEGAVTKERSPSTPKGGIRPTTVWKIDDAKRLSDTLTAIHRFVGKPRFTGYQGELHRQRIPLFPPRRDFVSQIPPMAYAASQPAPIIQLRKLTDVLAAGAQQCASTGDVAGLQRIIGDWRYLSGAVVKGSESLLDCLVAKVMIAGPAANFRDAAKALGMEQEAEYFSGLHDLTQRDKDAREKRSKTPGPTSKLFEQRSSVLVGMMGPMLGRQVKSPPDLTENDLRPGRYADYALFERICSWLAWALLGLAAGQAALSRYCGNKLARRLSERMQDLFRPSDWARVFLGGLVFPLVWYYLITRFTPWSAREWSLQLSLFIQAGGQFGCMALSMIILPAVIINGRLAKRGAAFGLAPRHPWIGWLAAVAALAGVPLFGGMMEWGGIGDVLPIQTLFALAAAAIWLPAGFLLGMLGRRSQALRRATLARLISPVWVVGMLLLAVLVPWHHAEESRWIQQDRLFRVSAESPAPSHYEYEIARILRGELLEMIGSPESGR